MMIRCHSSVSKQYVTDYNIPVSCSLTQKSSNAALKNRYGSQSSLNRSKAAFGSAFLGAHGGATAIELGVVDKKKKGQREDKQALFGDNKIAPEPDAEAEQLEKDKDVGTLRHMVEAYLDIWWKHT